MNDVKEEHERRMRYSLALRQFFEAHAQEWISARDLEQVAGRQAWRTRVSELRQWFQGHNLGTIENRQRRLSVIDKSPEHTVEARAIGGPAVLSEYRYLPYAPLGRDGGTKITQKGLF